MQWLLRYLIINTYTDDSISLDDEAWNEDKTFVFLAFRPDPEEFEVGGEILIATTTKDGYYKVEHQKIENDVNQPPIPTATHSNTGLQVGAGQQTASQVANDILADMSGHHMEQKSDTGIEGDQYRCRHHNVIIIILHRLLFVNVFKNQQLLCTLYL